MPFQFRTVQLGSPRQPNEGLRIGTVRRPPRGIPKEQYGKLDFFDVWLPTLAPSRELLSKLKTGNVSMSAFFQRYRHEMAQTGPRQTIQLLAELAQRTPISVGCFCRRYSQCHRSVLGQLVREAGDEAVNELTDTCVYTIADPKDMDRICRQDHGVGLIKEGKPWTTARRLLQDAQSRGQRMPILIADATDCSRLLYRGIVDDIFLRQDGGTDCSFVDLQPLRRRRSPQKLVLSKTGEKIAPGFIRPYALVQRPSFLN